MTTAVQEARPESYLGPGLIGETCTIPYVLRPISPGRGVVVTLYISGSAFSSNIAVPLSEEVAFLSPVKPLRGEDYPALVKVWDNDVDAIYDTV